MFPVDFMHPLFQVKMFMTFLRMRMKLLLRILLFGSTLIKQFWKLGPLKSLQLPATGLNVFKLIWINTKREDRVLIKSCSREYKQKITSISIQKYKYEGFMKKCVLILNIKIKNQKNEWQQLKLMMLWEILLLSLEQS